MVQTEDQYFFIHEAVAEALLCGVTEVKVDKLHSYVQELCSLMPEDEAGHTHMELQFKVSLTMCVKCLLYRALLALVDRCSVLPK